MKSFGSPAINDSKGCGGVKRVAPIGLHAGNANIAYNDGVVACGLTHGHPTGQIAGGAFAVIIWALKNGASLIAAINKAREFTANEQNQETDDKIKQAMKLGMENISSIEAINKLGGGWIAEEAVAISIYCALTANNFSDGIIKAVNHSGDSDSTGAITGNILGLLHGAQMLDEKWIEEIELKDVIIQMADDLHRITIKGAASFTGESLYPLN